MSYKNARLFLLVFLIIFCLLFNYRLRHPYGSRISKVLEQPLQPFDKSKFILHALSPEGFEPYTNSLKGFEAGYSLGFRVFEVDLEFTRDDRLVCFHQGMEKSLGLSAAIDQTDFREFNQKKYSGRLSSLSAKDLIFEFSKHPDAFLVLDTKGDFGRMIQRIVKLSQGYSAKPLNRIVPQIYGDGVKNLEEAMGSFKFPYVIYTLYRSGGSEKRVFDYLKVNRVSAVTYPFGSKSEEFAKELSKLGVPSFVHPVNSFETAEDLFNSSVFGIYSSNLSAKSYSNPKQISLGR